MADGTKIEWTDATWNIVNGCSVLSPGCTNCYAMKLAGTRLKYVESRKGLTVESKSGPVWNGITKFNDPVLLDPIRWKRPRKIFVCAHGDLFHDSVPDEWIDRVFAVMALAPHHVFQVLTKRSARMRAYFAAPDLYARVLVKANKIRRTSKHLSRLGDIGVSNPAGGWKWVWLGVSVEDQQRADERIPDLLATPAAVRWLSCEPLLGPIDLTNITGAEKSREYGSPVHGWSAIWRNNHLGRACIDWIVAGGESGSGSRPMHPDWARSLRDQCADAGVPFLFKQWGNWVPWGFDGQESGPSKVWREWRDGSWQEYAGGPVEGTMALVGKKAAGRLLDGVEHNGYPS